MNILIAHFCTHWVQCSGGVEKVVCKFANEMLKRGHEVTVLYIDQKEGAPFFPLDHRVKTINILYGNGQKAISEKLPVRLRACREFWRLFSLKKARAINAEYKGKLYGRQIQKMISQQKPDVVVACSEQSIKYVIDDAKCKVPVIGMIHSGCHETIPELSGAELFAMGKCKAIQVLLPSYIDICKQYIRGTHFIAIGNVVEQTTRLAKYDGKKIHKIVCVGMLSGRKNQQLLADAFALIAHKYPCWSVEFWGNYHSTKGMRIKKYIEKGESPQLKIMGTTTNIEEVYASADIFCMPSYLEGFPLALTEAMAAGLPAVGLKSCHAVAELIENEKSGLLVDNTKEALAAALERLMNDLTLRKRMGQEARRAMEAYAPDVIWGEWEDLLQAATGDLAEYNKNERNNLI